MTTFCQRRVLYPFAQVALLCALAVVFALAAKVSWYHPQRPANENIVSLKACNDVVATEVAVAPAVTVALPWVLCLVALLLAPALLVPRELRATVHTPSAHRLLWTARPPPAV